MELLTSLPREVIETQLAHILASPHFAHAPRLSDFLRFVVEESLEGRADRIKGYTIGVEVFDRPADFDPSADTIVRVEARALRHKLDRYFAAEGAEDPVRITLGKGSYVPGFHISWDGAPPKAKGAPAETERGEKPSIAVLPFDDFTAGGEDAAFAHGLTEETISDLSRFKSFSVFSRSTTEKAKRDQLSIAQIHAAFRPSFVVEGSIRRTDGTICITVQVVDAAQDAIILTSHFSHATTPQDQFQGQDEMAERIAARIAQGCLSLGQPGRKSARSGHANKWETCACIAEYYRYALDLDLTRRQDVKDGLARAVENDPGSSVAHALLSLIIVDEHRQLLDPGPGQANLDQALAQAEMAVACGPDNAVAFQALAVAHFHRRDFAAFDHAARRALDLNPGHPDMCAMIGMCHALRADWAQAFPLLERAIYLSPLCPGWYHLLRAVGLAMTEGPQQAIAELRDSQLTQLSWYHACMGWFLVEAGDMDAAATEIEAVLAIRPDFEATLRRRFDAWCMEDAIAERAVAAWRKAGLCIPDKAVPTAPAD